MVVFGVALAFGIIIVLAAVAMPAKISVLLTPGEKADYELLYGKLRWMTEKGALVIVQTLFAALILGAVSLLFLNLNPHIANAFRGWKRALKAMAVLAGSLACFTLLFAAGNTISSLETEVRNIADVSLFFFLSGLLWTIAGETGWAGDFLSWRMGVQGRGARPFAGFILGGAVGIAIYGLLSLNIWAFGKYLTLVTTVLNKTETNKSGEFSYRVYKLMGFELAFMLGASMAILSGLTTALSPTYRTLRQRLMRLVFPAAVLIFLAAVVLGIYRDASARYDMNKNTLAAALGVPEAATVSRTIILFKPGPGGATLQEWPLEATGRSFVSSYTAGLSIENLKKAEDYIAGHKDGSVFLDAARDFMVNGYYSLWDMQKAGQWQSRNSEYALLPRLMLVAGLRYCPLTEENLNYLRAYADEGRWYAGDTYAMRIAEGFMHFGLRSEAEAWVGKAGERGADIANAPFLKEEVLKDGKVYGRITVDGRPPVNARAGLLRDAGLLDRIDMWVLTSRLIDAVELDEKGGFMFKHLGKGEYILAVMADEETVPSGIPPDKLSVKNPPGVIKLGKGESSRNLGDIGIAIK
ncbi:MAG: hypothetical protein Q8J64_03055 [Thermodesulfovibrionales bacterium]|nr:hypothetical protein [Thermodesulfovibrionales bacterium]